MGKTGARFIQPFLFRIADTTSFFANTRVIEYSLLPEIYDRIAKTLDVREGRNVPLKGMKLIAAVDAPHVDTTGIQYTTRDGARTRTIAAL